MVTAENRTVETINRCCETLVSGNLLSHVRDSILHPMEALQEKHPALKPGAEKIKQWLDAMSHYCYTDTGLLNKAGDKIVVGYMEKSQNIFIKQQLAVPLIMLNPKTAEDVPALMDIQAHTEAFANMPVIVELQASARDYIRQNKDHLLVQDYQSTKPPRERL